jgi:hypothetical protein
MFRELDRTDECGCGSGKPYGKCCKRRKIRFQRNEKGQITQAIPIHPELEVELRKWQRDFREMFGRKLGKRDRVLSAQYLADSDDYWISFIQVGRAAKVPDELLFASRKTEFILAEMNEHLVPDIRKAEWEAAISEYFSIQSKGLDPFYVFTPLAGRQYDIFKRLVEKLDAIIIVAASAIDDVKPVRSNSAFFQFYFISRALCSLRTIREMFSRRYDDDCFSILRGIYECYLRTKLLRLRPEDSERFFARMLRDLGEIPIMRKKSGKILWDKVFYDGRVLDIRISNTFIVSESKFRGEAELYHRLYSELLGYVHPDALHLLNHLNNEGALGIDRTNDRFRAISFVILISLLLLEEIARCEFVFQRRKKI